MTGNIFKMAESEEFETQSFEIAPQMKIKKAVATTENNRASKTSRWSDNEVDELIDMLEERVWLVGCFSRKITTIET